MEKWEARRLQYCRNSDSGAESKAGFPFLCFALHVSIRGGSDFSILSETVRIHS